MMIKPPLVTFCSILGLFTLAVPATLQAQNHNVKRVAEREIIRRQESVVRAREAIQAGNKAMQEKNYDVAVQQYKLAVDLIPAGEGTSSFRGQAIGLFAHASVKLAEQRIAEGRYADAQITAAEVVKPEYAPRYRPALELLSRLEQPDYYNKTITPKHIANVDQVRQWLYEAEQYRETARYDLAEKRYHQVLNIDKFNTTARKGMEKVTELKMQYGIAAYNQARSELIWDVQKKWEMPVRRYGSGFDPNPIPDRHDETGSVAIRNKLSRIIIPHVNFNNASIREAIDFLKAKSREFDLSEPDPSRRGINIVLQLDPEGGGMPAAAPLPAADPGIPGLSDFPAADAPIAPAMPVGPTITPPITLSLTNVPLEEVLRYVAQLANLKIKIEQYAVAIVPLSAMTEQLITRQYQVPPGFLSAAPVDNSDSGPSPVIRGGGSGGGGGRNLQTAKSYLETQGVQFPVGASAHLMPSTNRLVVRNTQDNLDLIDAIVASVANAVDKQVEIESKFVEISQNNLKELSFDWLFGGWGGSTKVTGGTSGTGLPVSPIDYPVRYSNGVPVGGPPVTSGIRSGTGLGGAISANAVDALLFPSAGLSTKAPAILGMAGISSPEFQVVMRALDQKKGVDLLSAPRVTTVTGRSATIEVIREFIYPTTFEAPKIPQSIEVSTLTQQPVLNPLIPIAQAPPPVIPITPSTPTEFEMRKIGVILTVTPEVSDDGSLIKMELNPEVTEFEGFINYGSPIMANDQVLTDNVINQPVFSTRKVSTYVTLWDGQTVVIGGLMREDVQKVEDKVPFLGDIPLIGRAFRSSVDQHVKRNLVIFVTARVLNPAGEPINAAEEEEEVVEPLLAPPLPEAPLPLFTK